MSLPWHQMMEWVEAMRIVPLLAVSALLPIGLCFAQSKVDKPTNPNAPAKSQSSDTKAKPPKPKKDKQSAQNGSKMRPEQERSYAQAYKSGAVRKP